MRLERVVYHLFESDAWWLDENEDAGYHEVDREILLEGQAGEAAYVSWEQSKMGWRVAVLGESFFSSEAPVVRDYSSHPLWHQLIGATVHFGFSDSHHEVLQIQGGDWSTFVCAYESGNWGVDVLHIAKAIPAPGA